MKSRFSTLDIKAALKEVNDHLIGHYILNIYDVDSKTYLLKLRKCASKQIMLIESGKGFSAFFFLTRPEHVQLLSIENFEQGPIKTNSK